MPPLTTTIHELINLSYIEEVSQGDKDFEKEILQLFIDQVTKDLVLLNGHFESGKYVQMKQALHYMLTTISVIRLDVRLKSEIAALEALEEPPDQLKVHLQTITSTCNKAREAAIELLQSLG